MKLGRQKADGVLIYQHQYEDTSPEKYRVIKQLFDQWASEPNPPRPGSPPR